MQAALSRAEYLRTGRRALLDIPTWSRAFKHVERPYTNAEARAVVLAHTPARDANMPLDRHLPTMALDTPLFGFALAGDAFDDSRWVLLNIVVPAGCMVSEVRALDAIAAAAPTTFYAHTIDVHSFIAINTRDKRFYQTNEAVMPVSDYAYSLGINKLPEGGMRQFAFKVDAGNVLQDARVRLPVESRVRVPFPSHDTDWSMPAVAGER